jgi:hypothetical protein
LNINLIFVQPDRNSTLGSDIKFCPKPNPTTTVFVDELRSLRVYIKKNLEKEFITSFIFSAAVLILFIKKKNDELRLCVDYRELNEITIKNLYSLFLIEEAMNRLVEVKIYIKLNIRVVYNLIRVRARNE